MTLHDGRVERNRSKRLSSKYLLGFVLETYPITPHIVQCLYTYSCHALSLLLPP